MILQDIKNRTHEILEVSAPGDILSKIFDIFIMFLISLNVIAVILETVESLASQHMTFFRTFEIFSVMIFTVEYISRVWSCTVSENYRSPFLGRIRFIFTPFAIVDLLAILPFYLPMLIPIDLRFIRALRLFRLFRIFKMGRYSDAFQILGNVLKNKKEELFITIFFIFILLILASSLMYFIEHEAQPEVFSSIPDAMWWGVITLTTVGYGDVCPITIPGKILGSIIALLGLGMFALPAGILAAGFLSEIKKSEKK